MPGNSPRFVRFVVPLLGLLLAVHLILLGFFQITDFDTWYHLKEGELYVTTRSLPAQNPFAFTTAGREWIKTAWVADVLFCLVFRAAGVPGLVLLRLLLLFVLALMLYRILRDCGLHPVAAILLVFGASLALRFRLLLRPEILSFLLLLATMTLLLRLRDIAPRAAYVLLPLQVAWINVHPSFVFGIGIPGLVWLANLLPAGWCTPGWGRLRLDRGRLRHLAAAVALLPFASLLNPHGPALFLYPFRQITMPWMTRFMDWKGVGYLPESDPLWWEVLIVLVLVFLAWAVTALLLWIWERRLDLVGWGIVLTMGTYAVFRARTIPYFLLAILPLLGLAFARIAGHLEAHVGRRPLWPRETAWAAACALILGVSILNQALLARHVPRTLGVRGDLFPEGACAFLERHALDGRIFNAYEFGGYLMWRRWPANQVIIDGRYDEVLFDEALLEAHEEAYRSPAALKRLTARYEVDILVLSVAPGYRMAHLSRNPAWARVYWDDVAEVFVRRTARHADLIARHEYRLTGPESDLRYLAGYRARDPGMWRAALAELRRAVAENPKNSLAWLALAQEYRAAGPSALPDRLEALDRATALLAPGPETAELQVQRAEALLQLGRPDEAASAARQALRLNENALSARWFLAAAAERRGAWAEARDQLRTILDRLEPGHPEAATIRTRLQAVERMLLGEPAPGR